MSTGKKPAYDLTIPLLALVLIVHFGVIIPGVRAIRAKYYESKNSRPLNSE